MDFNFIRISSMFNVVLIYMYILYSVSRKLKVVGSFTAWLSVRAEHLQTF